MSSPGKIRGVDIPKLDGRKRRLGIPNVQDRLIQQALHQELNRVLDKRFSESSNHKTIT